MIHPVVVNPVLGPLVGVKDPVRWLAGRGYPYGAILHWDADVDPYTEQTGGPHAFNHAILSPQYQRNADGSYTDVGAKPAVDVFGGQKWLRSCGAVTNMLPSGLEDLTASSWIKRGTAVVAAGNLVSGIGPGDVYILNTNLTAGTSFTPSIEIKRVSTTGVFSIRNPAGYEFGSWYVDLSLLSDDYEKITSDHPSVSASSAFVVSSGGVSGLHFMYKSGVSPLSFYARNPQLTATSYPVPYVPPGVTQPASNATTTNGSWFALPDGSELWHALDGGPETDGVELVTNGVYKLTNAEVVRDTITLTGASNEVGFSGMDYNIGTIVGQRYVAHISGVASVLTANETVSIRGVTNIGVIKSNEAFNFQHRFTATANYNTINIYGNGVGNIVITNVSIQRIQPQPLTLATRVRMGVGSADLANSSVLNVLTPGDVALRLLTIQKDGSGNLSAKLSDGTNTATVPMAAWSRGDVLDFFPQVLTGGTQMRIGYKTKSATSITWGSSATYVGTFGPDSALKRLIIGFANAYPVWHNKITAWREQVSDARILEAMAA